MVCLLGKKVDRTLRGTFGCVRELPGLSCGKPSGNGVVPKRPPRPRSFAARYDGHVPCPRCGSDDTHVSSPFGGTVSEMLFQCGACGDGFGWMKWEHRTSDDLDDDQPPEEALDKVEEG